MTRRTLAAPATIAGVGVFTGARASLTIAPAPPGAGITLHAPGWPAPCPATLANRRDAAPHPAFAQLPPRCTAVGPDRSPPVFTTEHALGALAGLGITDAALSLDAPELPIDDGSARAFVDAILAAGVRDLDAAIDPVRVHETLVVESGPARLTIEPSDTPHYEYRLDYGPDAPMPPQSAVWSGDPDDFATNVAPARTFSLAREVEQMRALGLFRQFTPRDLLVIDDAGHPIDNAWRFPDEPARHKLLDLIGDLALLGAPLCARITADRSGHALNHAAARAIADHLAS